MCIILNFLDSYMRKIDGVLVFLVEVSEDEIHLISN